jgi:SAM-dependent methyltransferase
MLGYRRLAGVDVSAEQVERARLAGLDATVGEGFEYLNRTKSTWDFVLAVDVVEHLNKEELLRFIDQVAASLSPGGRFVIQTPNPDSIVGMRVRYGDLTHEVSLSPDCLTRILRQSGFASVEAREAGPIPNIWSPINTTRYILWKIINYMMRIYDIVETGSSNAQVFTRVYLISAVRCMKA